MADSELVQPLDYEPAVLDGIEPGQDDWLCRSRDDQDHCVGPSVAWFEDPDQWGVMLAQSGPAEWQRVDPDDPQPERRPVAPTSVDDVTVDRERISFDVDQPGVPVLVKASYFPNWRASGAEGPYRVAPNLMVVVPTDTHVELTYGREPVEWIGYALTALGVVAVVALAFADRRRRVGDERFRSDAPALHLTP